MPTAGPEARPFLPGRSLPPGMFCAAQCAVAGTPGHTARRILPVPAHQVRLKKAGVHSARLSKRQRLLPAAAAIRQPPDRTAGLHGAIRLFRPWHSLCQQRRPYTRFPRLVRRKYRSRANSLHTAAIQPHCSCIARTARPLWCPALQRRWQVTRRCRRRTIRHRNPQNAFGPISLKKRRIR